MIGEYTIRNTMCTLYDRRGVTSETSRHDSVSCKKSQSFSSVIGILLSYWLFDTKAKII